MQARGGVVFRIDGKADQPDAIPVGQSLQTSLKFFELCGLAWARRGTSSEHEICDPDAPFEVVAAERGPRLIGQLELRRGEQNRW